MKKKIFQSLWAGVCLVYMIIEGYANNPLITNFRTADPNPFVYNDTFYIVCGQDEVNSNAFDMYAWRLLSSTNLRDWTDLGQIIRPDQFSWMPKNRAWASCIVFKNGYFYFYGATDWSVVVLRATNITGPYQDVLGHALISSSTPGHAARDIDPMCFIDDDGQAYLFWGGDGNCRYVRMNSDMISLATSVMDVPGLTGSGYTYLEAPFVIKANNTYFLMYADQPWPSKIHYATSSSIAGPWTHRGIIGSATGSGTNHEGAAFYKGQWWYAYHTEELSNNNPYSRSVCVDKMTISGNTIQLVTYTDNNGGGIATVPTPTPNQNPVWSGGPYTLNGSSGYVDLPDGLTNNLYDFSVACWVNLNSVNTWARVFDFGVNITSNMFLTIASDTGYPRFAITLTGNSSEQIINGTSALPTGSWQHLAVVKSGNTGILYINKQEAGRNTSMTLRPLDLGSTINNYIGRSQYSSDPYLNGNIYSFAVYNRALTSSEVIALGSSIPGTTPSPSITPTATPGIRGDVNADGRVTIIDAMVIAQAVSGLKPTIYNSSYADVNCDGLININDALLVARYAAGLISSLGC